MRRYEHIHVFFAGLPDRPHHQGQHQLLPQLQEDVPPPASADGDEPRCPPWPGGLSAAVQHRLPQCIAAHVRDPLTL